MGTSKSKEALIKAVADALAQLAAAQKELQEWEDSAENNRYESLEEANIYIEAKLRGKAYNDCEGAHNCGDEEYSQEFIVGITHYVGTLKVEYNRHDKTYYYIDGSEYTFEELPF